MQIRYIIFLLLMLNFGAIYSQLTLYNSPKNGAFIAQNPKTKIAEYTIKGLVNNSNYSNLDIIIYQSGVRLKTHQISLNFINGSANFSQKIELKSGKYFYKIEYSLTGISTFTQTIDGIMVGDVYLIQGQSNSVAGDYGFASKYNKAYNDTFIRSFGNSNPYYSIAQSDTAWYKINADGFYNSGCVGEWGAVMAKNLLDSFNIPICLINGGVGGTTIAQHMPTFGNSLDLNSIYGRLLYRVQKAQLQNNITGIIYYQGESDGSNANLHDSLFRIIFNNWNKDFKGFKKLYVVQVRNGCGSPSIQLRDFQRKFEFTLNKCKALSANGMNNGDGCHFGFVNGYELLGKQIAALVSRDFYGSNRKTNIDPPNIKSIYYSNANQTEITLNLQNPSDNVYLDNLFYNLFKIEGDNSVIITTGFMRNNKVVLQLNKSSCNITGLSYDGLPYSQPWVKNTIGMALISFYNVPILKHQIKPFYQGCKKSIVVLGEDSIAGYLYQWKRIANNKLYKSAKIKVLADSVEKFELIITYSNSACKNKDTLMVYLSPDPIIFPELGIDKTMCANDTIMLKPNNYGFTQYLWKTSKSISNGFVYKVSTTEKIVLTATSQQLCVYKDSINIVVSKPIISLPQNIIICSGKDTLIQVSDTFSSYFWNNNIGAYTFKANEGKLHLKVINQFGCMALDSCTIKVFLPIKKLKIKEAICLNESKKIGKPQNIEKWYYQNALITDSIKILPPNFYAINLQDSNQCYLLDTIETIALSIPQFNLGKDTGYCIGKYYGVTLPIGLNYYEWNKIQFNKNIFQINSIGAHIFKAVNHQNCAFADTINLINYRTPDISQFHDSVMCFGNTWKILLPNNNSYIINNSVFKDSIVFKDADKYNILITNINSCKAQKTITIELLDCNTSSNNLEIQSQIRVYPNPFSTILNIKNTTTQETHFKITDILGQTILQNTIADIEVLLNLSTLNEGLYFLTVNNQYFKLLKIAN